MWHARTKKAKGYLIGYFMDILKFNISVTFGKLVVALNDFSIFPTYQISMCSFRSYLDLNYVYFHSKRLGFSVKYCKRTSFSSYIYFENMPKDISILNAFVLSV